MRCFTRAQRYALHGISAVALLVLAGCGDKKSPTDPSARARRVEALESGGAVSIQETVDALFLGMGPLIPRDGMSECPIQGTWVGFPRGAVVRVRVSTQVPIEARDAVEIAAGQVRQATNGAVSATLALTDDANPLPGLNEVTVRVHPRPRLEGCASDAGCVQYDFAGRGVLRSARIVEPSGQAPNRYAQNSVGRGVLGLCQVDARLIGGPGNSLMSGGSGTQPGDTAVSLTALDLLATRAVYSSPLSPGASRSDFLRAKLVNVQAGERRQ